LKALAIETSTERVSVAASDGVRQAVLDVAGGAQASHTVLPAVGQALAQVGLTLKQLDGIAFGQGPGAFTGLRTACALAQGLALGAGLPVLPLDSLSLIAQDARSRHPEVQRVLACWDARMGQLYWAAMAWQGGHWVAHAPIQVSHPSEVQWPAEWGVLTHASDAAVAGQWLAEDPERRTSPMGPHRWIDARPTATAMLALWPSAWQRGLAVDPANALPLYVRNKVADTIAEREALQAAKAQVQCQAPHTP
jgi:tRNA threonylcarbamoyladenosine biosynthesis protein TsaB